MASKAKTLWRGAIGGDFIEEDDTKIIGIFHRDPLGPCNGDGYALSPLGS